MSYILDALKRADSERERGTVPGLRSQSSSAPAPSAGARRGLRPPLLLGLAVAAVVAVAAFVWISKPSDNAIATSPAAPTATPPGIPLPAVEPAATQAPSGDVPAPAMAQGATDAAPEPTAPPTPILTPAPPRPVAAPAPPAAAPAAPAVAVTSAAATPTKAADTKASASPVPTFSQLSAEARAQLPQVNVTGSSYSENAAHRLLIVNGKVVQEGQEIAPGLTLERIGQRNAVLNHKGLRYSIGY